MRAEPTDLRSITRRIGTNSGILLGGTGIATGLSFATVALNARALGADGLGIIGLFQASAALLVGLFYIGSQQPMIRLGRQALEEGRPERVGIIAGLAMLIDTGMAILAGLCALLLIWQLSDLLGIPEEMVGFAQFYTIVIFLSGTATSVGILRLFDGFRFIAIVQVVEALFLFAVSIILYFADAAVGAYLVLFAVIRGGAALAQNILALRMLRSHSIRLSLSPREIRNAHILSHYLSYAWTTNAVSILESLRRNGDSIILGGVLGASSVGIYTVVKHLAGLVNKFSSAMYSSIFPEIASLETRGDRSGAVALLYRLELLALALGAACVGATALFGESILRMGFGERFTEGAPALALMLVAASIGLSAGILSMFVQVFVSPRRLFTASFAAFVAFAMVAPAAIYFFGLIGAAFSQIVFTTGLWLWCWFSVWAVLPHRAVKAP